VSDLDKEEKNSVSGLDMRHGRFKKVKNMAGSGRNMKQGAERQRRVGVSRPLRMEGMGVRSTLFTTLLPDPNIFNDTK